MDKFPDEFTRQKCHDIIKRNQLEMVKNTRKQFYDNICVAVQGCDVDVVLDFPEKLWQAHKVTLINELLERFERIKIRTSNPQCELTKPITSTEDLRLGIKKVIIEFIKA